MKFCSKCGTQLVDEAVVCTACGCAVQGGTAPNQPLTAEPVQAPSVKTADKKFAKTFIPIFNFVALLGIAASVFFVFMALTEMHASAYGSAELTYSYYSYDIDLDLTARVWADYDYMFNAFLAAIIAAPFPIVSLIFTIKEKSKLEKIFSAIFKIVVCALLIVLTVPCV